MKPAAFDYVRPQSLQAALDEMAATDADARILAGGQSLVPMMNFRIVQPDRLVDINGLSELDYVRADADILRVGALCRHNTLYASALVAEHAPLIVDVYRHVAHHTIRNRGTIGGNLCHADPASEMPAVMQALDAVMEVRSARGSRLIEASRFSLGAHETALEPGEILTEIRISKSSAQQGAAFHEISVRKGDFAIAGVAALLRMTGQTIVDARLVVCGVGDRATRLGDAERMLAGADASDDLFRSAARQASASVDPQSDWSGTAEYRRALVEVLSLRSLRDAASRADSRH